MTPPSGPRILAFAFNCHPEEGSEGGVGWAWARLLAGIGPTTVLVRPWPGTREAVATALERLPEAERPSIEFVEMPAWVRPVAGHDAMARFEYVLWMFEARRLVRPRVAAGEFDLAWHLTWANAWIGATASMLGIPFVYGPVGAGVSPPWRLVPALGLASGAAEIARAAVRLAGRWLNPFARRSWTAATLILAQNAETRQWLPRAVRDRVVVMPNAVFTEPLQPVIERRPGNAPVALFAGRLVGWKGLQFAIEAMTLLPGWRLVVCGDGEQAGRMRALAERLRVGDRVTFRGWTPRDEVLRMMREDVDVLVFPSLHDEGGWTVAEAVAMGLPAVCFDRGGPASMGATTVHASTPRATVARLAAAMMTAIERPGRRPSVAFDLSTRREELRSLLAESALTGASTGRSMIGRPPDRKDD